MRIVWRWQIALACMMAFLGNEASAQTDAYDQALQANIDTMATVAADGRVRIGEIIGMSPKLAEAVRAELAQFQYVPAERDGMPVESELRLSGIAVLNQVDGDQYTLTLKDVAAAPPAATILKATPPLYPPAMVRQDIEGSVEMALTIGSDGRIKEARSITSTDPAFEAAVKESLKGWRFAGGQDQADIEVALPVTFRLASNRKRAPSPVFKCAAPRGQARIEGHKNCLAEVEVSGTRIFRSEAR